MLEEGSTRSPSSPRQGSKSSKVVGRPWKANFTHTFDCNSSCSGGENFRPAVEAEILKLGVEVVSLEEI